jgi:hypothetical protein
MSYNALKLHQSYCYHHDLVTIAQFARFLLHVPKTYMYLMVTIEFSFYILPITDLVYTFMLPKSLVNDEVFSHLN